MFERYGSELRFTNRAVQAVAKVGLERGGGARGLRGVLEEVLGDAMFEVPGSVSADSIHGISWYPTLFHRFSLSGRNARIWGYFTPYCTTDEA